MTLRWLQPFGRSSTWKDMSHYGLADVQVSRARSAVRKAARLLSAAQARVR